MSCSEMLVQLHADLVQIQSHLETEAAAAADREEQDPRKQQQETQILAHLTQAKASIMHAIAVSFANKTHTQRANALIRQIANLAREAANNPSLANIIVELDEITKAGGFEP